MNTLLKSHSQVLLQHVSCQEQKRLLCILPQAFVVVKPYNREAGVQASFQAAQEVLDQVDYVQQLAPVAQVTQRAAQALQQQGVSVN